jgi:hypothetical protein
VPTPEEHRSRFGWPEWAAIIGLAVLFASGIVIALDDVVHVPGPVVDVALLVALAAALTVVGVVWAESRRRGLGLVRSLGRSLRALGRFILDFF